MSTLETIKSQIEENPVLLYMKEPRSTAVGFSSQTVQALMACGRPFSFVNILDHPDIQAEATQVRRMAHFSTFGSIVSWLVVAISYWRCIKPASLNLMVEAASPESSE